MNKKIALVSIAKFVALITVILISFNLIIGDVSQNYKIAITSSGDTVSIGGQVYQKSEVIDDFIQVAFPEKFPESKSGWPEFLEREHASSNKKYFAKVDRRWLSDNILYPQELPEYEVLRTWNKQNLEVAISSPVWTDLQPDKNPSVFENFNESLSLIINELADTNAPTLSYVSFEEDKKRYENNQNYLDLRIIPRPNWGNFPYDPYNADTSIPNLVPAFSTRVPSNLKNTHIAYVDDYILPLEDNNIGIGVCKILYRFENSEEKPLNKKQVKALMNECFLTMLGLVGRLSGEVKSSHKGMALYKTFDSLDYLDLSKGLPSISDYEKYMLRILYCPELKNGMTKDQVIRVLSDQNSQCLGYKK